MYPCRTRRAARGVVFVATDMRRFGNGDCLSPIARHDSLRSMNAPLNPTCPDGVAPGIAGPTTAIPGVVDVNDAASAHALKPAHPAERKGR
jgi:hypothetical protein